MAKALAKVPHGSNADIGVTKIITLGRKKLLVAEFTSALRIPDGPYEIQRITVTRRAQDVAEEDEIQGVCGTKIFDCLARGFSGCIVNHAPPK